MSYINAKLKNGRKAGITNCEVVLPVSSLENMSAEEVGERLRIAREAAKKTQAQAAD